MLGFVGGRATTPWEVLRPWQTPVARSRAEGATSSRAAFAPSGFPEHVRLAAAIAAAAAAVRAAHTRPHCSRCRGLRLVMSASHRPMPTAPLPKPLRAVDGLVEGAPPEDVFTWDTVSKRMPKILDSVLESLPPALADKAGLLEGVRQLQAEMRDGSQLRVLEPTGPWVGAEAWNEHLADFIAQGEGWHAAPWWLVENYMYKRLLEELARCGSEAAAYDPFEPAKRKALEAALQPLQTSLAPLLASVADAEATPAGHAQRRAALEATLIRSLWGNQADLSLSAGKVEACGEAGNILSDQRAIALDLLEGAAGRPVVIVLDNHGLEVLCDLVLVDAVLRLTDASVVLHVKDAPVFVSDVTEEDVPGILNWLEDHDRGLAERLKKSLLDDRLKVLPHSFYTSARAFWELPEDLRSAYEDAAAVVLKGDANYRRLLGDLHWPYDTDFASYAESFWPGSGLVALRTMKSGVALGVDKAAQEAARAANPSDWLTCGKYGQILAFSRK